jgi:hypothetical protein
MDNLKHKNRRREVVAVALRICMVKILRAELGYTRLE